MRARRPALALAAAFLTLPARGFVALRPGVPASLTDDDSAAAVRRFSVRRPGSRMAPGVVQVRLQRRASPCCPIAMEAGS